jgi:hypothetical protein
VESPSECIVGWYYRRWLAIRCATLASIVAIQYKKAILTYLDILGFRRMVEVSKSPSEILNILLAATTKSKISMGVMKLTGEMHRWTTTRNFSDLVVRHTEIPSHHNIVERLNIEIQHLVQIQCELMARDGILIRGGLCIKDCYIDEEFIFGPGLIQSYRLESQIAVFPRIVIDDEISGLPLGGQLWGPSIRRGEDAAYFIDYLYAGCKSLGKFSSTSFATKSALLASHKEKIETKLLEPSREGSERLDERATQKLLWAALYHNSVVSRLIEEEEDLPPSLKIQEGLLR